ncbi:hypothetical protein Pcinc_036350 [Petrolisthes cinctipes]|uniref:Uncharacterized protein n=1 Tax=Petrolisthes cinctipes TaxID=88211 RepID=A0AAE1BWB8_PETCI|nr:hypothetical protein Pcinc_036350 [Petrolisthes cinctipes]
MNGISKIEVAYSWAGDFWETLREASNSDCLVSVSKRGVAKSLPPCSLKPHGVPGLRLSLIVITDMVIEGRFAVRNRRQGKLSQASCTRPPTSQHSTAKTRLPTPLARPVASRRLADWQWHRQLELPPTRHK